MTPINDKTFRPRFVYWWPDHFTGDPYVSRVMRPLHRHFYRALIIESFVNSWRPYLPNDDQELWMLADAESAEQWLAHKDVVMRKFTLTEDGKLWQHKRILADWETALKGKERDRENGRKGGLMGGKGRPKKSQAEPSTSQDPLGPP